MKGGLKTSIKTPNTPNLKKVKTIQTSEIQLPQDNRIYIQNGKILCPPHQNFQHKNTLKKPTGYLQTIEQTQKFNPQNKYGLLAKKQQFKPSLHNNISTSNQYLASKSSGNQQSKGPLFIHHKPENVIYKKNKVIESSISIKNKPTLIRQQKYQKKPIIHKSENSSPKDQFLPQFGQLTQSPISMKTSYLSNQQSKQKKPFFKSKSFKAQIPMSMTNSKLSQNHCTFPIIKKYYQKEEMNQTKSIQKFYPKTQNTKYSMISPTNTQKSMILNHNDQSNSNFIHKKFQYFTQQNCLTTPNNSKFSNPENYASLNSIQQQLQTSIDQDNPQAKILKPEKLLIASKSHQNIINKTKFEQDYHIKQNQKANMKGITNQIIKKISQVKIPVINNKNLKSPKSAKEMKVQQHLGTQKKIQRPQIHKNKQYITKTNSIKQFPAQKIIKKQSKIDLNKKKQALNNLKKQHQQINDKKQEFSSQKSQKAKIKHLFSLNIEKHVYQDEQNMKMSLSIIEEKPYRAQIMRERTKKIQILTKNTQKKKQYLEVNSREIKKKIANDMFIKKAQKFIPGLTTPPSKSRRYSQTLQYPQDQNLKRTRTDGPISIKYGKKMDETMETQQTLNFQSLKISDFIRGPQLGRGKFGVVNLARHRKTGFLFALKTMQKSAVVEENMTEQVIREIKIQYFLNHSHLVKLYGFFDDKKNIYLLLEYCPDGQLYQIFQKMKKFPESDTCHIMKQLCQGIHQMHRNNIIHRDLKPENVVVSFGMCKICDFGWSIWSKDQFRSTLCGTPLYFSPQLLVQGSYNQKVDVWALGMMAFQMITGSIPFTINNTQELMKIAKAQIHYPISMSPTARDFIGMFLQRNPQLRVEMKNILKHKFIVQYNQSPSTARSAFKLISTY